MMIITITIFVDINLFYVWPVTSFSFAAFSYEKPDIEKIIYYFSDRFILSIDDRIHQPCNKTILLRDSKRRIGGMMQVQEYYAKKCQ